MAYFLLFQFYNINSCFCWEDEFIRKSFIPKSLGINFSPAKWFGLEIAFLIDSRFREKAWKQHFSYFKLIILQRSKNIFWYFGFVWPEENLFMILKNQFWLLSTLVKNCNHSSITWSLKRACNSLDSSWEWS